MKMFKNLLLMFAMVVAIASCDDDDEKAPADGIIASQDDVDLVVGSLQGDITGDITLAANQAWVLSGPLVVKEGGKLTIAAGTTIKAAAGGTNVYVAVEQGATIQAVGTAAAPIKITSNAATPATGDWGGVLIMGKAPITAGGTAVTEVVDFNYGGTTAADNSGKIDYLILEYTGARINGEKEFNGLTLYAVGSGTTISNVAVISGDDDAFEWFGGTVNASNLLAVNATDDMFDWTQGYSGTVTNAYGIREESFTKVSADPRGLEGDGNLDGLTPNGTPQSNPTFTNLTIVSNAPAPGTINDVVKIRRGSSATITNAFVKWGATAVAPGDFVDFTDALGTAAATANVSIFGTGTNLNTADNALGTSNATVTINANATGVASAATMFAWTGYTKF